MVPFFQQLAHVGVRGLETSAGECAGHTVRRQYDGYGGGLATGRGQMVEGESTERRVLSDVEGGTDGGLSVDEVVEGEREVGGLVQGLVRTVEGLDEPFAQANEVAA